MDEVTADGVVGEDEMALKITKTQDIEISQSEYNRLREEYARAFMMYCGAPPDFEEWAINRLQRERDNSLR